MNIREIYKLYQQHFLVDTDTRAIRKNTLFFALKGANFNGNTFAKEALEKGANYVVIDEEAYAIPNKTILVKNVLETLQTLAIYHRKQLTIPVIALTGSNGKTTTKELINAVLKEKYTTTATQGNLNNHIGVPLSVLSITPKTEIAIIEMGANHQKEIGFLAEIAQPDYGYITNFGKAHLEGFGGVEGVIKGKSELYTYLIKNNKTAFINTNDPIQVEKTKTCTTIAIDKSIQYTAADPFVKLTYNNTVIQSNLIGKYNYNNIAIAIAIGAFFKVGQKSIQEAIEKYIPKNNRSQIIEKESNTIILDAYNANPSSMKAAIETFKELPNTSKLVILGDMFELGTDSTKEHQEIVNFTDAAAFEAVYYVGAHFYKTSSSHKKFIDFNTLVEFLKNTRLKDTAILIKGSRGMQLERILDYI